MSDMNSEKEKTIPDSSRPTRVADPDAIPDPYVFGPPGSGSISQMYGPGSGSGSGSFYHQAKKEEKTMISTAF
jgi:hypothetical protein